MPYWRPDALKRWVEVEPEAVVASAYIRPDRSGMMLILFNNSAAEQQARVRVNRAALAATAREPVDYYHAATFARDGDCFSCTLKPHNFRMIAIE